MANVIEKQHKEVMDNHDVNKASAEQIQEQCEAEAEFCNMLSQDLDEASFLDETPLLKNDNEVRTALDETADKAEEYSEKAKEIEEKPERSFETGKIIAETSPKIEKGYEEIKLSATKEEIIDNSNKLTQIFHKAMEMLEEHTRKANAKDEIFSKAIKEQEDKIKECKENIEKNYPKQEMELEIERGQIEAAMVLYESGNLELTEEEYEAMMQRATIGIDNDLKAIKAKEELDKEAMENLGKQVEKFKAYRKEVRNNRWRPAAMIAAAYDKLVSFVPNIVNKFIHFRESQTQRLEQLREMNRSNKEAINARIDNIRLKLKDKRETLKSLPEELKKSIKDNINKRKEKVKENIDEMKSKIENTAEAIKTEITQTVSNNIKTLGHELNKAEAEVWEKINGGKDKIKDAKEYVGTRVLDSVKKVADKVSEWANKKEAENNPRIQAVMKQINNLPPKQKKAMRRNFERPYAKKYHTPVGTWDKKKFFAYEQFKAQIMGKNKKKQAHR